MSDDRTTEMLNLLPAIAREVGLFRQEVNARLDRLEADVREIKTDVKEIKREMRILHGDRFNDARKVAELEERIETLEGEPV